MSAGPRIRCKRCGDVIQSTYVHDFKYCTCKAFFVDGGGDYLRFGGERPELAEYADTRKPLIDRPESTESDDLPTNSL